MKIPEFDPNKTEARGKFDPLGDISLGLWIEPKKTSMVDVGI